MFFILVLLFIIALPWVMLYGFRNVSSSFLNTFLALGAGAMLALAIVHILPESLEWSQYSIFVFLGGFLFFYIIEEFLTPHVHDHSHGDHSHEDPHEHSRHIAIVTFTVLVFHTFFDGVAVRSGFEISETVWYSLIGAIALHQIPVSLSLVALLWNTGLGKRMHTLLVIIFALSAPLGYFFSDAVFHMIDPLFMVWLVAFVWGSLLYVSTVDLMPIVHSQKRMKYISLALFLIGAIGVSCISLLDAHHSDIHDKSNGGYTTSNDV